MQKRIVIISRSGKKIFGDWYESDDNSPLLFPSFSKYTRQDYNQLSELLVKVKFDLIYYDSWYVEDHSPN